MQKKCTLFLLSCSADSSFYKNISHCGEYFINLPGGDILDKLHFWGLNPDTRVKLAQIGLKTEENEHIQPDLRNIVVILSVF